MENGESGETVTIFIIRHIEISFICRIVSKARN